MLSDTLAAFAITALLVELTPGPNMAWLALLSATHGRSAGIRATLGIGTGLALLGALATIGLAPLLAANPAVAVVLRWSGAALMFWLAWEAWRETGESSPWRRGEGGTRWFVRGLLTNLLNPKALAFFVSVMPNFLDSAANASARLATLAAIYVTIATAIHLGIVAAGGLATHWLTSSRHLQLFRAISALTLVAIALWFLMRT